LFHLIDLVSKGDVERSKIYFSPLNRFKLVKYSFYDLKQGIEKCKDWAIHSIEKLECTISAKALIQISSSMMS